jgi:Flp pilus assembly protein TadG
MVKRKSDTGRRGSSAIEFALLIPWYVFLFVGALDFGFYSYALIGVQSAARISAMYTASSALSASDATTSCSYALDQLRGMPNVGQSLSTCSASPLVVTAALVTGPDGSNATSVTVTYTTPQLIPIPRLLPGVLTISRTVQMRVRS